MSRKRWTALALPRITARISDSIMVIRDMRRRAASVIGLRPLPIFRGFPVWPGFQGGLRFRRRGSTGVVIDSEFFTANSDSVGDSSAAIGPSDH